MLNVISYEKVYCLFPRATLHDHTSLVLNTDDTDYIARKIDIAEMRTRGFTMLEELEPEVLLPSYPSPFAFGWRWIDDSETWVINLDTRDVAPPPPSNPESSARTHDPVNVCGFSLRYNLDDHAVVEYEVVEGPSIEFTYTIGDHDLLDRLIWMVCYHSPVWDGK